MKRSWLVVALLLSVGINIGIVTVIGLSRVRGPARWEGRPERSGGPPVERLAANLGLQGEKRGQFIEQQQRFFESFRRIRNELEGTRRELRGQVASEEPDTERIDELLAKSAEHTAALDRLFIENVLIARQLLDRRQERLYFGLLDRLRRDGERRRGPERGR